MNSVKYGLVGIGNTINSACPYHYVGCKDNPKIEFVSVYAIHKNFKPSKSDMFPLGLSLPSINASIGSNTPIYMPRERIESTSKLFSTFSLNLSSSLTFLSCKII